MKRLFQAAVPLAAFLLFTGYRRSDTSAPARFKPGYYVTDTGKVAGLIFFNYSSFQYFDFKADEKSKKRRIELGMCSAFVVGRDTFETIHEIPIRDGLSRDTAGRAFARVVERGPISIYQVYGPTARSMMTPSGAMVPLNGGPEPITSLFIKKAGVDRYYPYFGGTAKDRKNLEFLFADHPDLPAFGDAMNYDLLLAIVRAYNENRNSW